MIQGDKVQYGCGFSVAEGWRNFDASPTLRFERIPVIGGLYVKNERRFPPEVEYGDIVKGLPVADASCALVYCSHILEHLALEDCRRALRNTHRLLRDGGTFRLVLPGLENLITAYCEDPAPEAALTFVRATGLGRERRAQSIKAFVLEWLGSGQHLWMWDYKSLAPELESAGFRNVRRAAYGDSQDQAFAAVEDPDRWKDCLGIECVE